MTTKTVELTDEAAAHVEAQVRSGAFPDASAYLLALIRDDLERIEAIVALQAAVDEGMASGISSRTIDEIFEDAVRLERDTAHT